MCANASARAPERELSLAIFARSMRANAPACAPERRRLRMLPPNGKMGGGALLGRAAHRTDGRDETEQRAPAYGRSAAVSGLWGRQYRRKDDQAFLSGMPGSCPPGVCTSPWMSRERSRDPAMGLPVSRGPECPQRDLSSKEFCQETIKIFSKWENRYTICR